MTSRGRRIFDMGRASTPVLPTFFQTPGATGGFLGTGNPIMIIDQPMTSGQLAAAEFLDRMRKRDAEVMRAFEEQRTTHREAIVREDIRRRLENEMRRREEEKREVEKMVDKEKEPTIYLETGEQKEGKSAVGATSRIFFVYVTPTGAEVPISKCPHIVKKMSRTTGSFASDTRTTVTEYAVKSKTTLKMVNLKFGFGSPKKVVNLFLDLDPEIRTIELSGLGSFGKFRGSAEINYKTSTYFSNREGFKLTEKVLREHFGLRIIKPATKGAGKNVRSLILDDD